MKIIKTLLSAWKPRRSNKIDLNGSINLQLISPGTTDASHIGMNGQPLDFGILNQLRDEAYAVAKSVGFHSSGKVNVPASIANLHAELSELFEAWRRQYLHDPCDKADKMLEPLTAAEEEMADIVLRAFDFAAELGIDLARAVRIKNAYNRTRPHRNGGKLV
jgi:NTP pyrophosphatase (non-canonical NTP hydrolase)